MNKWIIRGLIHAIICIALSSCGQSGHLYLPEQPAQHSPHTVGKA